MTCLVGVSYLSPSQISTLVSCERQWWWKYQAGVKEGSSEPLAMGGGFAHALEFGLAAGLQEYRDRRPPTDPFTDPAKREIQGWVADATIREAYAGYQARYPDEGLEREVTYIVNVDGCDRLLQVRVDGVKPDHLVEDKLRSGSSMRAQLIDNEVRQGRQLTAEIYCRWRDTGELVPVHLRCMKKMNPKNARLGMLRSEVEEQVRLHFQTESAFQQFNATRTLEQLHDFEAELRGLAKRADSLAAIPVPAGAKNTDHCNAYGRECPILAHCQGQQSHAELLEAVA